MRRQIADNGLLGQGGSKNVAVREQGDRVLRIGAQPFVCQVQKCFVFSNGEAHIAAKLLAIEGVLYRRALRGQGERLSRYQRLRESKGVASIHGIVAEKAEESPVQIIGAGLGDDINCRAARTTQFRPIIASVDLELLHGILAQVQSDTARVVVGFPAVDRDAVPPAVAAIEGQTALWCLFDAEVRVVSNGVRIAHPRRQQGKS